MYSYELADALGKLMQVQKKTTKIEDLFTDMIFARQFQKVNVEKFNRAFFSRYWNFLIKLPKIKNDTTVILVCVLQIRKFSKLFFPFFPRHNSCQCRDCNCIVNWNNWIVKVQILGYERAWSVRISNTFFYDLKQFPVGFDNDFQLIFSERFTDGFQFFKYLVHARAISPNAISQLFHRTALSAVTLDLSLNASRVCTSNDPKFSVCSALICVVRKSLAQIVKNFVRSFPQLAVFETSRFIFSRV